MQGGGEWGSVIVSALIATQSILLPMGVVCSTALSHLTLQGEEAWKRKVKAWMVNDSALFLASCIGEEERFSVGDPPPHSYSFRLPRWLSGKEPACQCRSCRRCGFDPWVRKIPWRRKWQISLVFLPGESHGWRSLADSGCSPWGLKRVRRYRVTVQAGIQP